MAQVFIGDLAQTFHFRRQTAQLKASVQDLTAELASGKTHDLAASVSGDFAPLSAIESSLAKLDAYDRNREEVALTARTVQASLEGMQSKAATFAPELADAGASSSRQALSALAERGTSYLESGISALNVSAAGRHAFSGDKTNQAAIDASTIETIRDSVSSFNKADDIMNNLDAAFGATNFEGTVYKGSSSLPEPINVAQGSRESVAITAQDAAIREVLKGYVAASLIDSDKLDASESGKLARRASETLSDANDLLIERSAEVGVAEARLDEAKTRNAAERTSLQAARNEIVTVDPYETAIKLNETRTQLQTLFSATARISDLSLTNFLR